MKMEDHYNYLKQNEYNKENENEAVLNAVSPREEDSLLIDLVKGYPHLYDKESKDYKDIIKKNNSWKEIGEILDATGIYRIYISFYQYCM